MNLFEKKVESRRYLQAVGYRVKGSLHPLFFTSSRFRLKYIPYVNACTYDK